MQATDSTLALQHQANDQAQRLLDGLTEDQLTRPTPCPDWDVRGLLNHLVFLHTATVATVAGEPMPDGDADLAGPDPIAATKAAIAASADALQRPGVLAQTFQMPWGEMSGEGLAGILMMDTVIHGWDLAKATDQRALLDPDLCDAVLARGKTMMKDEFRQPGRGFGPEIPVPPDAPACDRLAAFYGRQP
jgi:uncharacterized protein (TIGR03086 family)